MQTRQALLDGLYFNSVTYSTRDRWSTAVGSNEVERRSCSRTRIQLLPDLRRVPIEAEGRSKIMQTRNIRTSSDSSTRQWRRSSSMQNRGVMSSDALRDGRSRSLLTLPGEARPARTASSNWRDNWDDSLWLERILKLLYRKWLICDRGNLEWRRRFRDSEFPMQSGRFRRNALPYPGCHV